MGALGEAFFYRPGLLRYGGRWNAQPAIGNGLPGRNPNKSKLMVNRNLIRGLDLNKDEWEEELAQAMGGTATEEIDWGGGELAVNKIIDGKILRIDNEFVLVDVGYKSEGIIPLSEWEEGEEPPQVGEHVKVLIEDVEDSWPHGRVARDDRAEQAQGREDRGLVEGHGDRP